METTSLLFRGIYRKMNISLPFCYASHWLPGEDSNLNAEIQILVCYPYTTGQKRIKLSRARPFP